MHKPLVSAVVATYNEERHIQRCLQGLLQQTVPPDEVEILVVDGGSVDATTDLVQGFAEFGSRIRLLHNPKRIQVHAWNLGTDVACGRYVTLISAHTEYGDDYIESCLRTIGRTGAANVGGVQVPVGEGMLASVIAWAMQSPFAMGNARFRYSRMEEYVNDVFSTFLERRILKTVGGYDEGFPVNEDGELNYRLRKAGYTIVCSPDIRVRYHVRSSFPGLARQLFRYGFWRRRTQLRHPEYVPIRVYAPPLLLAGLCVSIAVFAWTRWWPALSLPAIYGAFIALATANAIVKLRKLSALFLAPLVLGTVHVSYGLGWWAGFLTHRKKHVRQWPRPIEAVAAEL